MLLPNAQCLKYNKTNNNKFIIILGRKKALSDQHVQNDLARFGSLRQS